MAASPLYSVALRKSMFSGTSVNAVLGATSVLRFYSGTAPTYADAPLSGNTQLAELAMSATPFGSPSGSAPGDEVTITANAITPDSDADASDIATFFRILDSAAAPHIQGTVGSSDSNLNLNSAAIQQHTIVMVSNLVLHLPAAE